MSGKCFILVLFCVFGAEVQGASLNIQDGHIVLESTDVEQYNASLSSVVDVNSTNLEFSPQQNYMNNLCNKKRVLYDRNAILMSPWSTRHPPHSMTCTVGVESHAYQNYFFLVTFKKMAMYHKSSGSCFRSRLDLFSGQSVSVTNQISDASGLCGDSTEKRYYQTSTSFLTLRFKTNNLPSSSSEYFLAVITPFHYGTCRSDEFKCSNGKCIQDNMLCDGYNNCGDSSDESHCGKLALSIAAIIGIVVGGVVLIAAFIVVCVCCNICCCACSAYESL